MHYRNEAPEAAGERVAAAARDAAGLWLAESAGDLIWPAGARAAAAGDGVPVNRVLLGVAQPRQRTGKEKDKFVHDRLISVSRGPSPPLPVRSTAGQGIHFAASAWYSHLVGIRASDSSLG